MSRHPATAFPASHTALLLLDVINPFSFPNGARFAKRWLPTARRIAAFRTRARRAGLPIVYVNDNFGQWRSDFRKMVTMCGAPRMPGAPMVELLAPAEEDFFVLKPTLSGFHETALQLLLKSGGVREVILMGFAADICVFFTAADAHMRDYRVIVPSDCVAAETEHGRRYSLEAMARLFRAKTTVSTRLRLRLPRGASS
jgi:nicotinamidase-related amidase